MRKELYAAILLLVVLSCSGCAQNGLNMSSTASSKVVGGVGSEQGFSSEFRPDRMLVWRADVGLNVGKISEAIGKATNIAEQNGGYIEWKSETAEESAHVRMRIPIKKFKNTVSSLEGLGTIYSKSVTGEDVTERYIDVEARLKNNYALRDRLKQLLDKAVNVKDILEIEKELTRVQSQIDSMEGTIKSLKGQVDFAAVDLNFKKSKVLGPLGYVFKGLWWSMKKLFVLSD